MQSLLYHNQVRVELPVYHRQLRAHSSHLYCLKDIWIWAGKDHLVAPFMRIFLAQQIHSYPRSDYENSSSIVVLIATTISSIT